MREGDFHPIQHDLTVMSISIKELLDGCNGFLLDQTQKSCTACAPKFVCNSSSDRQRLQFIAAYACTK
jgi:hypothetical protein